MSIGSEISDAPSRARINTLHPAIRQDVIDSILAIEKRGVTIRVTYGYRTIEQQNKLYAKGRTAPGGKVTNAKGGQSYHNYGLALDFCLRHKDGKVSFNVHEDLDADGQADWREAMEEFKAHGFELGGEWNNFRDMPHVQKIFGVHWSKLSKRSLRPDGYVELPEAGK
jgi:peptidoglycan L-alanyl-D-glutamate endopeptidase CwlK